MYNFTVLFEYFARYDNEDLNTSELYTEVYRADNVDKVIEEIEEDEEFDDLAVVDSDYIDQLGDSGRDIIYIKDDNNNFVYSRESRNVKIALTVNIENNITEDEYDRIMDLPDAEKKDELSPYILPTVKSFTQQFEKYFGRLSDYSYPMEILFDDLFITIIYKLKDHIEVGKLEYMIKKFSEDFDDGNIIMYDYDNHYYANYQEGEIDSGGFL